MIKATYIIAGIARVQMSGSAYDRLAPRLGESPEGLDYIPSNSGISQVSI